MFSKYLCRTTDNHMNHVIVVDTNHNSFENHTVDYFHFFKEVICVGKQVDFVSTPIGEWIGEVSK